MRTRTRNLWPVILPVATLLLGCLPVYAVGVPMIEAAYEGESLTRLNQVFAAHRIPDEWPSNPIDHKLIYSAGIHPQTYSNEGRFPVRYSDFFR